MTTGMTPIETVVWNYLGIDDPVKLTEFIENLRAISAGPGPILRTEYGIALGDEPVSDSVTMR